MNEANFLVPKKSNSPEHNQEKSYFLCIKNKKIQEGARQFMCPLYSFIMNKTLSFVDKYDTIEDLRA